MRALTAALIASLTAVLSATAAHAEEPVQARYLCKGLFDATEVRALFFNGRPSEVVLLTGSDSATRLLQTRSASGARYGEGDTVFWIKGEQATWQRGRGPAMPCEVSSASRGPTR